MSTKRAVPGLCQHRLGPCVDGTQTGRYCSDATVPGTDRCERHTYTKGA